MKRILFLPGLFTMLLLSSACFNSEGEYTQITEESADLLQTMETVRQEQEILLAAKANISQEKERLAAALKPYETAPAAGSAPEGVALAGDSDPLAPAVPAAPGAGGRVHVAQPGDTLSNIAARYNTDVNALLNLNPYLLRRNSYMVWENDNIQLP